MKASLRRSTRGPLHVQNSDGGIVSVTVSANKKHDAFVVGRFKCVGDSCPSLPDCSDLVDRDLFNGRVNAFRVIDHSHKGCLGDIGDLSVSVLNLSNPAGRDDVLPLECRIKEQVLVLGMRKL